MTWVSNKKVPPHKPPILNILRLCLKMILSIWGISTAATKSESWKIISHFMIGMKQRGIKVSQPLRKLKKFFKNYKLKYVHIFLTGSWIKIM